MSLPTSAQYSLTIRVAIADRPGMLGRVATAIGDAGGTIGSVDLLDRRGLPHAARHHGRRDRPGALGRASSRRSARSTAPRWSTSPTARCGCTSAARSRCATSRRCARATTSRWPTRPAWRASAWRSRDDRTKAFQYTIKRNTVAVVSDGTAVLGLGDIGPEAAMPVMEGKAMLFKEFGGVDAFPICLDTKDPDEIVADRQGRRADVRRHQPRGHLGAALLRDRGAPEGRARHPRLPRRPARHRGRHAGRADQRAAS